MSLFQEVSRLLPRIDRAPDYENDVLYAASADETFALVQLFADTKNRNTIDKLNRSNQDKNRNTIDKLNRSNQEKMPRAPLKGIPKLQQKTPHSNPFDQRNLDRHNLDRHNLDQLNNLESPIEPKMHREGVSLKELCDSWVSGDTVSIIRYRRNKPIRLGILERTSPDTVIVKMYFGALHKSWSDSDEALYRIGIRKSVSVVSNPLVLSRIGELPGHRLESNELHIDYEEFRRQRSANGSNASA